MSDPLYTEIIIDEGKFGPMTHFYSRMNRPTAARYPECGELGLAALRRSWWPYAAFDSVSEYPYHTRARRFSSRWSHKAETGNSLVIP